MTPEQRETNNKNLEKARFQAIQAKKWKRKIQEYIIFERDYPIIEKLNVRTTARIALIMLYLAEGSKKMRGCISFGNSDYRIIGLFLRLLRRCYPINEAKFRCTVQCRADQSVPLLEKFWAEVTHIRSTQFYKARVDPRTQGKPTRRKDYKGVCRIDYFSAEIALEIEQLSQILTMGI